MSGPGDAVTFRPHQTHPSAFVAPSATVCGDVTLAEDSSVWFGAVVRGDTAPVVVGRGSNVQDTCVLHADPGFPCTLGEGVTLGHAAIVHGATVGDYCVIGMRAVVMNGAVVGDHSIVGVGAVITANTHIPPRSLVLGIPGKVRRQLRPDEEQGNQRTARHYVELARAYREAGDGANAPRHPENGTDTLNP